MMSLKSQFNNKRAPLFLLLLGVLLSLIVVIVEAQSVLAIKKTVRVIVPVNNVQAFVPLKKEAFEIKEWPREFLPPGALTSIDQIEGKWSTGVLLKGMPVISDFIKESTGTLTSSLMSKGNTDYRYVAVPADDLTTFGNKLSAGDYVDVIGVMKGPQGVGFNKKIAEKVLIEEILKQDEKKVIGVRLYTKLRDAEEIEKTLVNGKVRLWVTAP
ncbi:hypothetical protein ABEV55_16160 [Aneurinibacillus thermoaerophilus]|uniref:Flp pilus assembly protein CpaB n=1 Tax=Aneurinibacillus thermoaerophilus TaxID=143495 RepID=UPI002E1C5A49|nr:hypothetical protein [Aneurinibacillus thermoaerophilus]